MAENCEAYEAHMETVRDYLEERLAVSAWSPEPRRDQEQGGGSGDSPGGDRRPRRRGSRPSVDSGRWLHVGGPDDSEVAFPPVNLALHGQAP